MHRLKNTNTKQRLLLALILAPIVFLLALIIAKSVNVPYWDQWELVPVIKHVHAGHFYFEDFWQQQNEHRLLFPRIVMIGAALVDHWNVRVESLISFVIACASFVLLLKTVDLSQQKPKLKQKLFWLPVLLSLIWFSPVQAENWFWGWQIQWFLNVIGIVAITYGLAKVVKNQALSYSNLLLMLIGGVVASYSLGNGVLIWPLLVIALVYLRVPLRKLGLTIVAGAVTTGLYYHHYTSPMPDTPKTLALKEPVLFAKYFLTYVGRPLSFVHRFTPIPGFVLLMVFASCSLYLLVKRPAGFKKVVPWVVLGLYSVGSAFITALSRMSLGLGQAYASRYTTISSLLLVATIMIVLECRTEARSWLGRYYKLVAVLTTLLVFGMVLVNFAWGIWATYQRSNDLQHEKACTHMSAPTDACLLTAYPAPSVVQERLDYLKQIHWGGY